MATRGGGLVVNAPSVRGRSAPREVPLSATLEMMRCDRRNMTLSRPGCTKLWLSANTGDKESRPRPWEGRAACITCPVGAANAGVTQSSVAGAVEALQGLCPRCRRTGARMIRDRLCISCANRDYEVHRGRDRKGNRPGLTDRLYGVTVSIIDAGGARELRAPSAVSPTETMIAAARKAGGWLAFTRPASAIGG